MRVDVFDGNVEQALRSLKKKFNREGSFKKVKAKQAYEKPCQSRRKARKEAVKREKKRQRLARNQY
ncbi:MAG: 30S ribosomal protein S21 [Proteobacteria bacterium]|nr:30S ribosomal protein S21 [Pseudomonadota bacterium]